MTEIKLYLKHRIRPLVIYANQRDLNELYKNLLTRDIIQIGPIIFKREDFKLIISEETNDK